MRSGLNADCNYDRLERQRPIYAGDIQVPFDENGDETSYLFENRTLSSLHATALWQYTQIVNTDNFSVDPYFSASVMGIGGRNQVWQ